MMTYRVQIQPSALRPFLLYVEALKSTRGADQKAIWVKIDGEGAY